MFSTSALLIMGSLTSCTCAKAPDSLRIDGSSTVYVISEAIAEEYKNTKQKNVSIGISGTGGGFKKLCTDRVDIIGASRSITQSEKELCQNNEVDYIELPIAYDGIVVVVNKENNWIDEISVSRLKQIFEPAAEDKVLRWNDIDPAWPDRHFEIFAPGISSGTYDYFTKAVVGKEHSSRGDMTTSEDDNVLVHGISSTLDSLGFFSFAYYWENQDKLKALGIIDDTRGKKRPVAVMPSRESIHTQEYSPLSRLIFLYTKKDLSAEASDFVRFYLKNSSKLVADVGFIPLSHHVQQQALAMMTSK